MTSRQIIIVISSILTVLIISLGISFYFKSLRKERQRPKQPPVILKVNSAYVNYSDVLTHITASGRVVSQQSVDVIAEVQGKILQGDILLKKGTNFKKNDILVRIFNQDSFYSLQARKSNFLNLLANILPDLKIDYPDRYPVWVSFFENVTIQDELPPLPEIKSNQEKIFLASKSILSEYFAIKSDEINLKKYNIYAPYNGAFQDVSLEVGSVANPGSRIAKIIKTDELEVEVPIESSDANWINKGDKAELNGEDSHKIGTGIVVRKSDFVDPSTQSINIYLSVIKEVKKIFAGEYVKVKFSGMKIPNAMEIPRNAVFNTNEVFIVDSGYLAKRTIDVQKITEKTIIFNGIEEGLEMVVQPLANANVNMAVQTNYGNVHAPEKSGTPSEDIKN